MKIVKDFLSDETNRVAFPFIDDWIEDNDPKAISILNCMIEFAKLQAVDFMNWRNDVKNFDKNILRKNPDITSKELYEEYLKL